MDKSHRRIMYIGTKARKDDRANMILNRVWHGPGTVVDGIPPVQASKLLQHPDEFVDVTDLTEEQLAARSARAIAEAEEKRRLARSPGAAAVGGVLLEYATEEQIIAELERRKRLDVLRQQAPADKPSQEEGAPQRRDALFVKDKINEAIDKILQEGDSSMLDDAGVPTREAVQEIVGFPISADEYADAIGVALPVGAEANKDE